MHSTPVVINLTDVNADGRIDTNDVPDIVVAVESRTSQLRGEVVAVSGDDGRVLFTAGGPDLISPWSEVAVGDLDGDGVPEIVAVHADGNQLIAFDRAGVEHWRSDVTPLSTFNLGGSVIATGAVRNIVRESQLHQLENLLQMGRKEGMMLMDNCIYDLYCKCRISYDTAVSYARNPEKIQKQHS